MAYTRGLQVNTPRGTPSLDDAPTATVPSAARPPPRLPTPRRSGLQELLAEGEFHFLVFRSESRSQLLFSGSETERTLIYPRLGVPEEDGPPGNGAVSEEEEGSRSTTERRNH